MKFFFRISHQQPFASTKLHCLLAISTWAWADCDGWTRQCCLRALNRLILINKSYESTYLFLTGYITGFTALYIFVLRLENGAFYHTDSLQHIWNTKSNDSITRPRKCLSRQIALCKSMEEGKWDDTDQAVNSEQNEVDAHYDRFVGVNDCSSHWVVVSEQICQQFLLVRRVSEMVGSCNCMYTLIDLFTVMDSVLKYGCPMSTYHNV